MMSDDNQDVSAHSQKDAASSIKGKRTGPDLIVSVESRKGGVGKTTAAFCLAKRLRRKEYNYAVLLLDLDVTGTNAADVQRPKNVDDEIEVIKDPGSPNSSLNLLSLFEQCFLQGKVVPKFSVKRSEIPALRICPAKVNILGSLLYRGCRRSADGVHAASECVLPPSILFNDVHSFWLQDFVKTIVANFVEEIACSGQPRKTAIILDNSPGYVGVSPIVQDWLTDMGPDRCKFLTVTSLDTQDLLACERAIADLHGLYVDKWTTSCEFIKAKEENGTPDFQKVNSTFFLRLATNTDIANREIGDLKFYFGDREGKGSAVISGDSYCTNPAMHIGVIINRVPYAVRNHELSFVPPSQLLLAESTLGKLLVENRPAGAVLSTEWMVAYDENIENQFYRGNLRYGDKMSLRQKIRLDRLISKAQNELNKYTHMLFLDHNNSGIRHGLGMRVLEPYLGINELLSNVRAGLTDSGLGYLARLVSDDLLPKGFITRFSKVIINNLKESFEGLPFNIETKEDDISWPKSESLHFYRLLIGQTEDYIRKGGIKGYDIDTKSLEPLVESMFELIRLALPTQVQHSRDESDLVHILSSVLAVEYFHLVRKSQKSSKVMNLSQYFATDYASPGEFINVDILYEKLAVTASKDEIVSCQSKLARIYKACAIAQSRLLDVSKDAQFLLQLINVAIGYYVENKVFLPIIKGIADKVIVRKSLEHSVAERMLATEVQNANYMGDFDEVLGKILVNWGVDHG